jgi:hypothetical protein
VYVLAVDSVGSRSGFVLSGRSREATIVAEGEDSAGEMCERWEGEGRKRVARDKGAEACRVARESRTRRAALLEPGKDGSGRRSSGEKDATGLLVVVVVVRGQTKGSKGQQMRRSR